MSTILNIAAFSTRTLALGPGRRGVIWVQGCPLHCRGCVAPDWIPFKSANMFSPLEILDKFDLDALDGLTFSGGEPMEQAEGLAMVARLAKQKKDMSIICFSGYRYERLMNHPPNPGVQDLLEEIDVLIDGPYVHEQNDSIGLRGSSNQRVIHLTNKLMGFELESQKRRIEVTITNGELSFVGIPTPSVNKAIAEAMDEVVKG